MPRRVYTLEITKYGFVWGPMEVERVLSDPEGGVVVWLKSKATGEFVEVRLSPGGQRFDVSRSKEGGHIPDATRSG